MASIIRYEITPILSENCPVFNSKEEYIEHYNNNVTNNEVDEIKDLHINWRVYKSSYLLVSIAADYPFCGQLDRLNIITGKLLQLKKDKYYQNILNDALKQSLRPISPNLFHEKQYIQNFLVNIFLCFGSNPNIIKNCEISQLVGNGISPTLLGGRGKKIIKRRQKIGKLLKTHLCCDVANIVVEFTQFEYFENEDKNSAHTNCTIM